MKTINKILLASVAAISLAGCASADPLPDPPTTSIITQTGATKLLFSGETNQICRLYLLPMAASDAALGLGSVNWSPNFLVLTNLSAGAPAQVDISSLPTNQWLTLAGFAGTNRVQQFSVPVANVISVTNTVTNTLTPAAVTQTQ